MPRMTIAAIALTLAVAPAWGQSAAQTGAATPPAKPNPAHAVPAKPAVAASTPESRSAAALALSHQPTLDEGTAQRIREAALSYADLAIRGGWPLVPAG